MYMSTGSRAQKRINKFLVQPGITIELLYNKYIAINYLRLGEEDGSTARAVAPRMVGGRSARGTRKQDLT